MGKLTDAVLQNDIQEVKNFLDTPEVSTDLIDNEVDINGFNSLHIAIHCGFVQIMMLLLQAGSNVNQTTQQEGLTALHIAVDHNQEEAVKFLLTYPVDINAKANSGKTPLDIAKEKDYVSICAVINFRSTTSTYFPESRRNGSLDGTTVWVWKGSVVNSEKINETTYRISPSFDHAALQTYKGSSDNKGY